MATKASTASTSNSQTGKTKRDIWLVSTKMALHEAMLEASAFWRSMTVMEVGARHVASRAARYAGCFIWIAKGSLTTHLLDFWDRVSLYLLHLDPMSSPWPTCARAPERDAL
jgi:hypothetical protein